MRIANFNSMSASNRQNDILHTRNGKDRILDARDTTQHNSIIYTGAKECLRVGIYNDQY